MIPKGRVDRPGTPIVATSVTIHNTGNSQSGANANAHARALVTGALLSGYLRSWHFTVDDFEIYRHIPTTEKAYHAGPAANASSIGVEVCQHPEQNNKLAYENAAWLAATLLHQIKMTPTAGLRQHHDWTRKNCPSVLRGKPGAWKAFVAQVAAACAALNDAGESKPVTLKVVDFTSGRPEAAAAKLEAALALPVVRSIIRSEALHGAGRSETELSTSSWQPSHLKAQYNKAKTQGWIQAFKDEAKRWGFSPGVMMAIASRETNMRNIIGDGGHGYGIMQIDDRSFPDWVKSGAWKDANLGIAKGALVLADKREQVEQGRGKRLKVGGRSFVGEAFNGDQLLRITIASYNSGLRAYYYFSTSGNPDEGTTGRDYSADVLHRAMYFSEFLGLPRLGHPGSPNL
nr:N-acetylmuramoyl-L-alanine amidase [Mesorhizobium sp. M1E.F.Ca.ET.041.01.1.1]